MGDDSDLVAIVATIGAFATGGVIWFMALRAQIQAREHLHAERLVALEKGLPPPVEPEDASGKPVERNSLKAGIFWLFLGVGVILSMRIADPASTRWAWGIIPVAVGLGDLTYWLVRRRTPS